MTPPSPSSSAKVCREFDTWDHWGIDQLDGVDQDTARWYALHKEWRTVFLAETLKPKFLGRKKSVQFPGRFV
jgi:hypothetical protein